MEKRDFIKEDNMEKVYVVTEDSFDAGCGHCERVEVFGTREKAKVWFDSLVEEFKRITPDWADEENNEYYEEDECFEWSVEGFYSSDHYLVKLSEKIIH